MFQQPLLGPWKVEFVYRKEGDTWVSVLFSICMGVFNPVDTLTVVLSEFEEGKRETCSKKQGNWL